MNAKDLYFVAIPLMMVIAVLIWVWARSTGKNTPNGKHSAASRNSRRGKNTPPVSDVEQLRAHYGELTGLCSKLMARRAGLHMGLTNCAARLKMLQKHQPDHATLTFLPALHDELQAAVAAIEELVVRFKGELEDLLTRMRENTHLRVSLEEARQMRDRWSAVVANATEEESDDILRDRQIIANYCRTFSTWVARAQARIERQQSSIYELERVNAQHSALPRMRDELALSIGLLDALRVDYRAMCNKREELDVRLGLRWNFAACRRVMQEVIALCEQMNKRHEEHFGR